MKQARAWTPLFLLRAGLSEIFASLDTFVSLRLQRERPGETNAFVHAFISLGGLLSETFASMDAFASPSLQGDGLPDRTRQGIFPARESCGKCTRVLDCIRREMVLGAVDMLDAS